MSTFISKSDNNDEISIVFNIEADEVMAIGEKMESINENAYMNGYNWEAFLNSYLKINQPDLLIGLDTDSEAGTYVALYIKKDEARADQLIEVIKTLISTPDRIYSFLEEHGEEIEWD